MSDATVLDASFVVSRRTIAHLKMRIWTERTRGGTVKRVSYDIENGHLDIVGEKPKNIPYLRVGRLGGEYIGALEGRQLLGLAQQIARVMGYRLVRRTNHRTR